MERKRQCTAETFGRVEAVAQEYGLSVEETEYIAKAAGSLYKLTSIHLVKKERFMVVETVI